jgi:hypothetical protein
MPAIGRRGSQRSDRDDDPQPSVGSVSIAPLAHRLDHLSRRRPSTPWSTRTALSPIVRSKDAMDVQVGSRHEDDRSVMRSEPKSSVVPALFYRKGPSATAASREAAPGNRTWRATHDSPCSRTPAAVHVDRRRFRSPSTLRASVDRATKGKKTCLQIGVRRPWLYRRPGRVVSSLKPGRRTSVSEMSARTTVPRDSSCLADAEGARRWWGGQAPPLRGHNTVTMISLAVGE